MHAGKSEDMGKPRFAKGVGQTFFEVIAIPGKERQ